MPKLTVIFLVITLAFLKPTVISTDRIPAEARQQKISFTSDPMANAKLLLTCRLDPNTKHDKVGDLEIWDCLPEGSVDWTLDKDVFYVNASNQTCDELVKISQLVERFNCGPANRQFVQIRSTR